MLPGQMALLALGRRSSRSPSSHLPRLSRRSAYSSKSRIGSSVPDQAVVVTGSLSGAKHVSKLVPPSASLSIDRPHAKDEARLLVSGPDAIGIVASFSQLLFDSGCGIFDCTSESSQVDDHNEDAAHHGRMFFQRIVFDCSKLNIKRSVLASDIDSTCLKFGMECRLVSFVLWRGYMCLAIRSTLIRTTNASPLIRRQSWGDTRSKIAIFVSKNDHCLWELLLRHRAGEIQCDIPVIISNHDDLRPVAETFNIPYHVFPVTEETKHDQERKQMDLLREHNVDLLVLARYMQVLTPTFCDAFCNRIINIHHSFLPAFMGKMPYHRAHERGVKLIGATAHYTTMDLDQGPIIEQDIMRVSHRDDVKALIRKGRTLEKNVLVAAVKSHLEDRIIVNGNKCIVFAE